MEKIISRAFICLLVLLSLSSVSADAAGYEWFANLRPFGGVSDISDNSSYKRSTIKQGWTQGDNSQWLSPSAMFLKRTGKNYAAVSTWCTVNNRKTSCNLMGNAEVGYRYHIQAKSSGLEPNITGATINWNADN